MKKKSQGTAELTKTPYMVSLIRAREDVTDLIESDPIALDEYSMSAGMKKLKDLGKRERKDKHSLTCQGFRLYNVFEAAVSVDGHETKFEKAENLLTYLFAEKVLKLKDLKQYISEEGFKWTKLSSTKDAVFYLIDQEQESSDPEDEDDKNDKKYSGSVLSLKNSNPLSPTYDLKNTIIIDRKGNQLWPKPAM